MEIKFEDQMKVLEKINQEGVLLEQKQLAAVDQKMINYWQNAPNGMVTNGGLYIAWCKVNGLPNPYGHPDF